MMTGPFLVVFQLVKYIIKYGSLYYFYLQAQKKLKENEQLKQQWYYVVYQTNYLKKVKSNKQILSILKTLNPSSFWMKTPSKLNLTR